MAEWLDVGVYDRVKNVITVQEYAVPQGDIDKLSEEGFLLPTHKLLQAILSRVAEPVSLAGGIVWRIQTSLDALVPYYLYSCTDRRGRIDVVVLPRSVKDFFTT